MSNAKYGEKKKKEQWKIFLLEETRSKKAILCLCLVVTESRTDFTFQLLHLIPNYIDLVHKILTLSEFVDFMLLFSYGWELKEFALSCWMCVACVLLYVHASTGVETIQNCLKTIHTIIEVGQHCWRWSCPNPLPQAGSARAHPVRYWTPWRIKTPELVDCFNLCTKYILMFGLAELIGNRKIVPSCTLLAQIHFTYKSYWICCSISLMKSWGPHKSTSACEGWTLSDCPVFMMPTTPCAFCQVNSVVQEWLHFYAIMNKRLRLCNVVAEIGPEVSWP